MPVNTSGRIIKTRKVKRGTAHQKNHRWESFTTKISKLNSLDPIRRVRRHDIDAEDLSTSTSYFRTGLEKWQELNMSEGFIGFTQDVLPMCDSLPQILHFEDKIMESLVAYLEKKQRESVEPLLELMTDFAHDLGPRFEKHYSKALELITSIAGTPQDVEVIEWSFSSLAFLFKYLSKLVVPDLRSTYDLMAPLLGKHRQRPHIARFAAEAMSFLIKKAGAPGQREKSLPLIINHAKVDLDSMSDTKEFGLYYHGLMTMFAEAMKGNGLSLHTTAPSVFRSLVLALDEKDLDSKDPSPWMNVICGVLTSMVHHSSSDTFGELLGTVIKLTNSSAESFAKSTKTNDFRPLLLSSRMIGIVAGVRKGTRISDWPGLLKAMSCVLKIVSKQSQFVVQHEDKLDIWNGLIHSVAITLQYTPMDAMIPFISAFMDALTKEPLAKWFLTFCSYLSDAEPERFRSIVLPYFQRFIVAHWSDADNGDTLSVMLPKLVYSGVLPSRYGKDGFTLPQSWQDQIVSKFERLEVSPFPEQASPAVYDRSPATWHDRCLPKYNALLEVLDSTVVHPSTNARIAEILLRKLKLALRPSSSLAPEEANFIVGRGFSAFSRMTRGAGEVDRSLEPLLRAAAPRYARLPNFLEALLDYETSLKASVAPKTGPSTNHSESEVASDLLTISLISNLSTSSHELRLLSLRLLDHIHTVNHGSSSEALAVMIMIEQTPLDLQTARSASMHIRKLATLYPSHAPESWLKQAIPAFCFGMLTVKFAQIWEDASASLKQIAESKAGEEAVAKLAFEWLQKPSMAWDGAGRNVEQPHNNGLTDFECSNLMKLDTLAKDAQSEVTRARDTMLQKFAAAQELVPAQPNSARAQALRVLSAAPGIAEKRSRQLVPMFLSWASREGDDRDQADEDNEPGVSDWTRKDQKAQLDLFGLFLNTKSLFKADEVYKALVQLIANGDIEIQKSALKAICTWKNPSIKPYEENLLNLLDEARFKDEIAILLQGDTLVQHEHRENLMPVLLRLLYGRSISRKGAASGRAGMEARRLTILRNLALGDIGGFLDIALGELRDISLIQDGLLQNSIFEKEILSVRKQVGFVHMIEGVSKELGTKVAPFTRKLADSVLYCIVRASRQLDDDNEDVEQPDNQTSQTSLLKVVRTTGLKCLTLLFTNAPEFEWLPYINTIDKEIISPRLENLPIETAQGVSVMLKLISTWSASEKMVIFLASNENILAKVTKCLAPQKSKDEVKLFVLNIINNVVKLAQQDAYGEIAEKVMVELLTPNMDHFLIEIGVVLRGQHDISKDLLEASVETVSQLAPFVTTSSQAQNLVDVSIFLLDQPSRRVSPKTKGGLLLVLEHFVPLYELQNDEDLKDKVFNTVTSLFGFFKDKISREVLSRVLMVYSQKDPVIGDVAGLCVDLNSFVEGRLDEPDYDRRLKAFNKINTLRDVPFTARQWTPLLFNMLYYIRHDEEFGILSSNSSDGICQFIDTAGKANEEPEKGAFKDMLSSILIPALFAGARELSEVIRREYLKVMAHLVRTFPTWSEVSDMLGLLAGDDELESSFFSNILTAGKGRQSGALGQLATAAERGELTGKNVSHFFIPVIEHFIFDRAEGNDAHNLAAEATTTVGILAGSLEWPQYRAMLRRFIGYIEAKPELEKQIIRLLGKVIDALALAAPEPSDPDMKAAPKKDSTLARTMPKQQKLADDLISNILPPLTAYLHDKDESTVSLRVPVAVIIVRLLKLLPQEQLNERLPAVLTDICHILRSKAQESRDMTRDTLTKICVLLGPSCFGFVLKELRGALARGYQLHVLSYTMHSILVATTPEYAPGDLDYCLPSIVAIIMDDIFGATGQEKDAEEYVSKMKEVKSSKSHDSMELIARTATLSRLTDLVRPIQVLLKEKLNLRMVRKIDELLNRISNGLLKNSAAHSRDSLIFCYEVIQDVYNSEKPQEKVKDDYRLKKYLIQKGAKRAGERGSTTVYTYKLVRFAFDVLRSVLKKYDNLRIASNLAGFIPILGDAVVQAEEEVKVAAFRLLTTIVKVPLKVVSDGTNLYRVATAEATRSISANLSTAADISQGALKLISVVLRDRPDVPVKDTAVDELLTRLKDDLTEPERRHVTFNFLRAVLDSKVETAVVYDTLDYVGTVMVTNPDKDTRDLARGAYFQFLRDYPQKKSRWSKQLAFIIANLKYEQEGGRLSILEVIHLLLSKSSDEFVQEVAATTFVPLIFVLANDDSEKCRMAAGEIIKQIFKKADQERLNTLLTLLRSWVIESSNPSVVRLALQTYGFYYDSHDNNDSDVAMLLDCIHSTVKTANDSDSDWEQIYAALQLASILVQKFPNSLLSSKAKALWSALRICLSYPHAWVKLSAARLTGTYFADFARTNIGFSFEGLPLKGSGGLKLQEEDIRDFIRRTVHMFKTPGLTELLADEIVKNLVFLGRCAGVNDLKWGAAQDVESDDDDEEDEKEKRTTLQYLFGRLSFILRRETSPPRAPALVPKTSALQLLQLLTSKLAPETLIPSLQTLLLPLSNLTDTSIPIPYSTDDLFKSGYEALRSSSEEIMENLKRKVGTKEYTEALLRVREGVKERRVKRSAKRKVEAVSAPERFGEGKRKKVERKKERRKERGAEHAKRRNEY
ncbi:HEAT repeat protein-like protein [Stipitochalara longipes BDJ]|nr:HEAT repeat protein-like protein [Stipitochalara longipes BDJ]